MATKIKAPENNWGFRQVDYGGYIPCIELCVCYYQLGNIRKAVMYNNKAGTYKPDDPAVIYNRKFFKELKG
jgi:hypothetical protein